MDTLLAISDWLSKAGGFGLVLAVLGGFIAILVKQARTAYGTYLFCLSYWLGSALWLLCFVMLHDLWGWLGIILGLLLAGIGIVPLCVIAVLFHAHWAMLGQLVIALVMVLACRYGGLWISQRDEERQKRETGRLAGLEDRVRTLERENQSLVGAHDAGDE